MKITPTGDYDSSEKLSETDIKEFLLSKKEIFHRKYKTFVLSESEALTYADALIIDSKIALEDGFLSKRSSEGNVFLLDAFGKLFLQLFCPA